MSRGRPAGVTPPYAGSGPAGRQDPPRPGRPESDSLT
jgi:hypothetical protein